MMDVRISLCEDSYQFNQIFEKFVDFDTIVDLATSELIKASLYRKGNYWASFSVLQDGKWIETPELFAQRIKI